MEELNKMSINEEDDTVTFKIKKNPFDRILYSKDKVTIQRGLNVLVGCNGCGKSTMMKQFISILEENKLPLIKFDNYFDGGGESIQKAAFFGDFEFVSSMFGASEGERIYQNYVRILQTIGGKIHHDQQYKDSKYIFVLIDAIDSGLSVDNIIEIKDSFNFVQEMEKDKVIFFIVTANEYEMARKENCINTRKCKPIKFKSYDDYRDFIIASKQQKDEDIESFAKKSERKKL